MSQKNSIIWFTIAGIIGVLFGVFYAFFGLAGFPAYNVLIPKEVIIQWSNGLYGAAFIGFSFLLFFVGRHAFKNSDKDLMKALLYGIFAWLIVEALFSFYYQVFFNVGVDIALMIVLGFPLIKGIQSKRKFKK
jgi:hypothetical protein